MTIARPWPTPTATAKPPAKWGDLFLEALSAAFEEGKATGHWQAGKGSLKAIEAKAKEAGQSQDAAFRRMLAVAPEEVGGE